MAFHTKYRPLTLSKILGHESAVTRLQGIVNSKKLPNAIALFGPTSAGKTTLARAFAADVNKLETIEGSRDFLEVNGSVDRSIDDVRQIIQQARFKPSAGTRFILIDEAHGLISNQIAANALLKILEEPPKNTMFILASMESSKFQSTQIGKALSNRCTQFVLESHTQKDLLKQALRIAKGEKMNFVLDDEYSLLKEVARNAPEMRTLANLMESLDQYYHGLKEKPKRLKKEDVSSVLSSLETQDDVLALQIICAVYQQQFKTVQRCLLDVSDGFQLVTKLLWLSSYVLNATVLDGAKHRRVWVTKNNVVALKVAKEQKTTLGDMAAVNTCLVEAKARLQQFATSPEEMLSACLYRLILEIKAAAEERERKKK